MVLSAVEPAWHLRGKVLGLGMGSVLQFSLWAWTAVGAASLRGPVELSVPVVSTAVLAAGFAIFGPLFAVAGARASRPEEVAFTGWIPLGALLVAYAGGLAAIAWPDAPWVHAVCRLPVAGLFALWAGWQAGWVAGGQGLAMVAGNLLAAAALWGWAERVYARWMLRPVPPASYPFGGGAGR
ncbi:MAG TPA: hypothetical protein VIL11_08060, partial [Limnochordales bacterium]